MSATIWKYLVPIQDEYIVEMPSGSVILSADLDPDGRHIAVWAWVRTEYPPQRRRIYVRGTCHPSAPASPAAFIGTVVDRALGLVWHVFDGGAS